MAEKFVDARGLSCPQPVLDTKKALEEIKHGTVEVLVDTVTSKENVSRMAKKNSCQVDVETLDDGEFKLLITKTES
ncbi:MAG: sulfurtransferase TusA family protein [bacterium]